MAYIVVNSVCNQLVVSLKGNYTAPIVGKGASGNNSNGKATNGTHWAKDVGEQWMGYENKGKWGDG